MGREKLLQGGKVEEFEVNLADMGTLREISIGQDTSEMGGSGHLHLVEIIDTATHTGWFFECDQLPENAATDKRSQIDLTASLIDPATSLAEYSITVHTSDVRGASTDASIYVTLWGTKGGGRRIQLPSSSVSDFERGRANTFTVEAKDVGDLNKLRIGHDNKVDYRTVWH